MKHQDIINEIESFSEFGESTNVSEYKSQFSGSNIPVFTNEFWTSKQRAAHSLHEVSYRACFKPQLPQFFINRLTEANDWVFDPFMGRGTTPFEAALMGRNIGACDVNPLSRLFLEARLSPPTLESIAQRLDEIPLNTVSVHSEDPLLTFFHPNTLTEILSLKKHIQDNHDRLLPVDRWIAMVTTNRLTGHSKGFLSVYTLPPNQAVSVESQEKINKKRNQTPEYRSLAVSVLKKSKSLLKTLTDQERNLLSNALSNCELVTASSDNLANIGSGKYQLVVTSPPFLDVINYQQDNWMRCWFNGIDASKVNIWQYRKLDVWLLAMKKTLFELKRILKPGGWIAFEVGEVRKGTILLEQEISELAQSIDLKVNAIIINQQDFTKTSACWGVDNQKKGTNTNRIVLMRKL